MGLRTARHPMNVAWSWLCAGWLAWGCTVEIPTVASAYTCAAEPCQTVDAADAGQDSDTTTGADVAADVGPPVDTPVDDAVGVKPDSWSDDAADTGPLAAETVSDVAHDAGQDAAADAQLDTGSDAQAPFDGTVAPDVPADGQQDAAPDAADASGAVLDTQALDSVDDTVGGASGDATIDAGVDAAGDVTPDSGPASCVTPDDCPAGGACEQPVCDKGLCALKKVLNVACCAALGGTQQAGHCVATNSAGRKKTLVPTGAFWMGCNSAKDSKCAAAENPQHYAEMTGFWLDIYEVTVADYKACVGDGKCPVPSTQYSSCNWDVTGREQHPVNCVTWPQAQAFCQWEGGALPTEAQWELGARGGCEHNGGAAGCQAGMRTYPWGETTPTCAEAVMFDGASPGCGKNATWAVGQKAAGVGPYGAKDMAGGVMEWVRDGYDASWYSTYAAQSWPLDAWQDKASGDRSLRGGGWSSPPSALRASQRVHFDPGSVFAYVGFRCVQAAP